LNQLITKLACLVQQWRKHKPKYWWRTGSKADKRKFQDVSKSEFSWLINDSNNYVMYCYVCRKTGPDISDWDYHAPRAIVAIPDEMAHFRHTRTFVFWWSQTYIQPNSSVKTARTCLFL